MTEIDTDPLGITLAFKEHTVFRILSLTGCIHRVRIVVRSTAVKLVRKGLLSYLEVFFRVVFAVGDCGI